MSYTLKVEIADDDLKAIRERQYNLCLTKGVRYHDKDMPGNVVFSTVSAKDIAPNLEFRFEDKDRNQVYMISKFQAGVLVTPGTQISDISEGMKATFDDHGSAKVTRGEDVTEHIIVDNNWKAGGQIAVTNYDLGTEEYITNWVSSPTPIHSTHNLTPIKKVGVFFDANYVTNAMIDMPHAKPFQVDLTGKDRVTVRYEGGEWSVKHA